MAQAAASLSSGVTWRSVLLGLLVAIFVNLGSPAAEALAFSNYSWSYLPEGGVLPFLLLLGLNAPLRRWRPRLALTRGELLCIFAMGLVANCTPIFLMFFHLSAIISPHYFASDSNHWAERLLPLLPPQLIVNSRAAALAFYEGQAATRAIPWRAWAGPLSHWLPFLAAMLLTGYAWAALFRRPWREQERLAYPLMQLPLTLTEEAGGGSPLTRQMGFWIGLALPLVCTTAYVLHTIAPSVPAVPVDHLGSLDFGQIAVSERAPWVVLNLRLNLLALGVAYFVPSQLLLSIWVFFLLRLTEEVLVAAVGLDLGSGGMFTWGNACVAWQSGGAFFALGLATLWAARRHLGRSWRAAWRPAPAEWADEVLSPRWTWGLLLGGSAYLALWLHRYNLPWGPTLLFGLALALIYLGMARVVCDAGIFYFVPPLIGQNLCIYALGTHAIGPQGMMAFGLSYSWHGDVQTVLPALAGQCFRLREAIGGPGRRFSLALGAAVAAGLAAATLFIIWFGYHTRAISWNTWVFRGWGPNTYEQVLAQIEHPFDRSWPHLAWFGGGAAAAVALTVLRLRFPGFPLHPMGLAVCSSFTIGPAVWLACLLGWAAKSVLLRAGGLVLYRRAAPFFVGLCAGHFVGRAVAIAAALTLGVRLG
jgi:hypothetical protein